LRKASRILYTALVQRYRESLSLRASLQLWRALESESTVFISTGFIIPGVNAQETDGPLGAAALTKALVELGAQVVVLTEEDNLELMENSYLL